MMTRSSTATAAGPYPLGDGERLGRLRQLIDWAGLGGRGWDPGREVFAPDPADAVFGFAECRAAACDEASCTRMGLCWRCYGWWRASPPETSFASFCQTVPARATQGGDLCRLCRTPGHERPARTHGFCQACFSMMRDRDQTAAAYLGGDDQFPAASPRPSFGRCMVVACDRWASGATPALCDAHDQHWRDAGRPTGGAFGRWSARQLPLKVGTRVAVLRGLAEGAQLEVLYGLQCRARAERRTSPASVQGAVNALRARGSASVLELPIDPRRRGDDATQFLAFTADRVTLALADAGTEATKDAWDLRVFGRGGGVLRFGLLSQQWLGQAAKQWALERLNTVEKPDAVQRPLGSLARFSESLRRHRHDDGIDPTRLSRADVLAFSNDLAHLEAAGRLSRATRRKSLEDVDRFLREARGMGLSKPGRPLAGLPDDVVVHRRDRILDVVDDDRGRALPQVVVDQLLDPDALERLEAGSDADARAIVELEAHVGRRTGELCGLRWDCLTSDEVIDETGRICPAPVLVHDMPKVGIRNYHLPIGEDAAEVIRAQQARVQARYPDTPTAQLALFPAPLRNPRGVKPRGRSNVAQFIRAWVDNLPRLVGPGGEDYDRSEITFYSWRHCYAQRHADRGTPIEVVAALMGHNNLSTTRCYYQVTQERQRRAVDLLAKLQVDRAGDRSRPTVERLLDSEVLRDAVGQVAVPFGVCREPTNVKAHGQACPFRHQCFGCTHFHSDPSFLPELRAQLARLLGDRERLRAAIPQLEDWARNGAIPSTEEIAAVRRVIDRCQELLTDVADDERAQIEEAITTMRRTRAQLDTSVPVRFLGVVTQPSPTLFPNVSRQQEAAG